MDELKTEKTYTLQSSVEYANGGEMQEGKFINLKAPTSKNLKECAFLRQAFFRALPDGDGSENDTQDKGDSQIDGQSIMTMIMMSDVDISPVLLTARELFTCGLAMIDGEQKLTKPLMDEISMTDLEAMTGEYIANFIIASELQKMNAAS